MSTSTAPSQVPFQSVGAEKAVAAGPVAQPNASPPHLSSATTLVGTTGSDDTASYTSLPTADTPFTGVDDLFAVFAHVQDEGDCVVVAPASAKQFKALRNARDSRGRRLRLFFLADKRIIIATLPGFKHESLHMRLSTDLSICMAGMGLAWDNTGAQTFRAGASSGEGDSNGRPVPARKSMHDWPTIVFEAGYTQTLPSLRAKMGFWFAQSNHDVKIVVLAKAYPERADKRILLEQWQERLRTVPRPGATATRRTGQTSTFQQPACLQTINITWAGPVPFQQATLAQREEPGLYNVTKGPLRLSFEALCLRPPTPQEHDIVFQDDRLQYYASRVWAS